MKNKQHSIDDVLNGKASHIYSKVANMYGKSLEVLVARLNHCLFFALSSREVSAQFPLFPYYNNKGIRGTVGNLLATKGMFGKYGFL